MQTKDPKTIRAYQITLNAWDDWLNGRNITADNAEDLAQNFVNYFSKTHSPTTVRNYYSRIKKYLKHLGIIIDEIELPAKHKKELYPLKLSDIHSIFSVLRYNDQVLFGIQISSGTRIGEMMGLRKRDFVWLDDRYLIKIPSSIAKFKKARTTVVSKEMSEKLKPILRRLDQDDLVFGTTKGIHVSEVNKEYVLRTKLDKIGLDMKYEDTGRYQINTHSFRAYFITKVSRHDPNIAKKMSGQEGYLLQYDRISDEELVDVYKSFEADLTIFDLTKRDQVTNQTIAELKRQISEQQKQIDMLFGYAFKKIE